MKFYKLILFVIFFIGLIILQREVFTPMAMDAAKSDLFLTDMEDVGSPYSTTTVMTDIAHMQCNRYIADELGPDIQVKFADKPITAFSMGGYYYLINSEVDYVDQEGINTKQKFVCSIHFDSDDGESDAANYDNWSIVGISGLDGLM